MIDDFSRECLAAVVDNSLSGVRVARELDRIAELRGLPCMVVSDNGTELTSNAILQWQEERRVEWHYIAPGKPMQKTTWSAAVDCVGGTTLANVLARTNYGGAVAASGLTGGADLPATVMPFILRGVALLGVDSVQTPIDRRRAVWARLGTDLRPAGLAEIGHDVTLADLEAILDGILQGAVTGRNVVDLRSS